MHILLHAANYKIDMTSYDIENVPEWHYFQDFIFLRQMIPNSPIFLELQGCARST